MCTSIIQVHICGTRGGEIRRIQCDAAGYLSHLVVLTDLDYALQLLYQIDCENASGTTDQVRVYRDCEECMLITRLIGEYQAGLRCIEMERGCDETGE